MPQLAGFFFNILRFIDTVLVPLIFAVAFIAFLIGVVRYFIANQDDSEAREKGRTFVFWGVIGFVVMFALWGIVNLLIFSLGFDTRMRPPLPLFGPQAGGPGYGYGQQQVTQSPTGKDPGIDQCGLFHIPPLWICPDGFDCRQGTCVPDLQEIENANN